MSYCGESTLVKSIGQARHAVSLRCRSWGCPDCSDTRKAQLIAQAIGGAPSTFLTLTMRRHHVATPALAAAKLVWCWRLVRLRIMRRYGWRKLPFIAVFEPHVSGWPHLHIMLRSAFIDWQFIRDCMAELADSPQVQIERIDNKGRVAGYCAKYCGKGTAKFGSCKRYWMSQDYDLRTKPPKSWSLKHDPFVEVVPCSLQKWLAVYQAQGWTIEQPCIYRAILTPPRGPPRKEAR